MSLTSPEIVKESLAAACEAPRTALKWEIGSEHKYLLPVLQMACFWQIGEGSIVLINPIARIRPDHTSPTFPWSLNSRVYQPVIISSTDNWEI